MIKRCRTRRAERVVLQKIVAIEQVNFFHWRLGGQIQDVGAAAAETDNGNSVHCQFAGNTDDTSPA